MSQAVELRAGLDGPQTAVPTDRCQMPGHLTYTAVGPPSNIALERTAGAHSLAPAAERQRYVVGGRP